MTRYRIAGQLVQSIVASLAKNIALPVCVYLTCTWIFSLPPVLTFIAVLMAARPNGVNAFLFAERYNTAQAAATPRYFYRPHRHCYRFLYCSIFIRQVCFSGLASIPPSAIQLSVESQGVIVFPAILLSVSTATVV